MFPRVFGEHGEHSVGKVVPKQLIVYKHDHWHVRNQRSLNFSAWRLDIMPLFGRTICVHQILRGGKERPGATMKRTDAGMWQVHMSIFIIFILVEVYENINMFFVVPVPVFHSKEFTSIELLHTFRTFKERPHQLPKRNQPIPRPTSTSAKYKPTFSSASNSQSFKLWWPVAGRVLILQAASKW